MFRAIHNHIPSKVALKLHCKFIHVGNVTGVEKEEQYLGTRPVAIIQPENIEDAWIYYNERINEMTANFLKEISGLRLKNTLGLHISVSEYTPLGGSSRVELPDYFRKKRAIIKMKNTDTQCLKGL